MTVKSDLVALSAKATPGPWELKHGVPTVVLPANEDDPRRAAIAQCALSHGLGEAGEADKANAALIVWLRNNALAEIVALRARVEELEADKLAILNGAGSIVGSTIDAASERVEKLEAEVLALRTALRKVAIESTASVISADELEWNRECVLCDQIWPTGEPERHATGCLAEQIEKDKGG